MWDQFENVLFHVIGWRCQYAIGLSDFQEVSLSEVVERANEANLVCSGVIIPGKLHLRPLPPLGFLI